MTQKEIATKLDILASRGWKHGREATSKQCWFLASLILKADAPEGVNKVEWVTGLSILDSNDGLTSAEASRLITELLAA